MPWKIGDSIDFNGWYNGHIAHLFAHGTYEYYRPLLAEKVRRGIYGDRKAPLEHRVRESEKKLGEWDKEWIAIPLEERRKRWAEFVRNQTPRQIDVKTDKGFIKRWFQSPSRGQTMVISPLVPSYRSAAGRRGDLPAFSEADAPSMALVE